MSARSTPQERLEQMVEPLLFWFSQSHRDLPWRREPSPYHVWVSEVMLQQTRVEAVRPYYERFLAALPTVQALAGCPQEQLLKLWEGLGYYSRARNLQRAAQEIVRCYNGQLPASYDLLKKLPGIGDYTAGAIASIAFDLPVPAVDGNVLRVLTRVLACPDDIALPATKEAFRQLLLPVEPTPGAGAFNQALMELGAVVCLPNSPPQCLVCPLQGLCLAHQQGCETDFPVKTPKKARRIEQRTLLLFSCTFPEGKRILLHRRPEKGVLRGMWEFPALEGKLSQDDALRQALRMVEPYGLFVHKIAPLRDAKHIFTHIEWQMSAWLLSATADSLPETQAALPEDFSLVQRLADITLPSAFKAYRTVFGE